ncbi:MAG TPA: hypothetical protein PK031_04120 [Pseudomonadales bacterium]|nr:hypothetical protein [Pseudomonadales bacterium]
MFRKIGLVFLFAATCQFAIADESSDAAEGTSEAEVSARIDNMKEQGLDSTTSSETDVTDEQAQAYIDAALNGQGQTTSESTPKTEEEAVQEAINLSEKYTK